MEKFLAMHKKKWGNKQKILPPQKNKNDPSKTALSREKILRGGCKKVGEAKKISGAGVKIGAASKKNPPTTPKKREPPPKKRGCKDLSIF